MVVGLIPFLFDVSKITDFRPHHFIMSLHQFQNFNANDCTSAPFITLARINLKITRTTLSPVCCVVNATLELKTSHPHHHAEADTHRSGPGL